MCGETADSITAGTTFINMDRDIDRLSHELSCLIDLGVLTSEEEAAFSAFFEKLRTLLIRAGRSEMFSAADRHELSGRARLLAADIDLAFQRLCFAA